MACARGPELRPASGLQILEAVGDSRGRVVLVNIWATWCIPCREEFPDLIRIRDKYKDQGLDLILVSTDFEGNSEEAQGFLRDQGVNFPSFIKSDKDQAFIEALNSDWSGALPASLLYNRLGEQVHFWEGQASYTEFETEILKVLKGADE